MGGRSRYRAALLRRLIGRRNEQHANGDTDAAAETTGEIRNVASAAGPPHQQAERR